MAVKDKLEGANARMIYVTVSGDTRWLSAQEIENRYEHDAYTLTKAFYPDEQILIQKDSDIARTNDDMFVKLELSQTLIKVEITANEHLYTGIESNPSSNDKEYKNQIKRTLYKVLKDLTKKELPWGILTGVRPTKLVLEYLEQNQKDGADRILKEIEERFLTEYLCSEEKTNLSLEVAKKELSILESIDYKNSYSIYIGIPFCPTTCLYCSFTSYSIDKMKHMVDRYLEALKKEITYSKDAFHKKLSTLYIGGGTPTSLSEEQLEELLRHIDKTFDTSKLMEYTVEAGRPDSITREKLRILKKYGVTRISINPQSMVQRTLDVIGRKHSVEDVIRVFHEAREEGHHNINMDLIVGLPGEREEDIRYTLEEIEKLNPESLTVHTLAIKRAARLNMEKETYKDMAPTDTSKMLEITSQYAKDHDYAPYYLYRQKNMADNLENVGYSKGGMEGIYNMLIMEEKQTIIALGAGALSKFIFYDENRIERVENVKSLNDYIGRIDEMIERKKVFLEQNKEVLERKF